MQQAMQQSAGLAHPPRHQSRAHAAMCSFDRRRAAPAFRRAAGPGRRRVLVRAEEGGAPQQEARIAALEKLTRSGKAPSRPQRREPPREARSRCRMFCVSLMPYMLVVRKGQWREGQLFPVGWEQMGIFEKGWQLWAGERGFLFWSNKLALQACIFLGVAWVLFRFVGPALGLYTLTNDLMSPPNE